MTVNDMDFVFRFQKTYNQKKIGKNSGHQGSASLSAMTFSVCTFSKIYLITNSYRHRIEHITQYTKNPATPARTSAVTDCSTPWFHDCGAPYCSAGAQQKHSRRGSDFLIIKREIGTEIAVNLDSSRNPYIN